MKKAIAYILTLAMLCPLLTACVGQGSTRENASSASNGELSEIKDKLFTDWYAYAIRCEELFGSMRWALSYLDPFFEDHSWDSLQIAWAAMNKAKFLAEHVEPPEAKMTTGNYDKLVQHGKDVGSFWFVIDSIRELKDSVLGDYSFYQQCLSKPSETIFLSAELATFEHWAHVMQQIYDAYLQDFAIQTDCLLLSLDDIESSVNLSGAIAENCPQINAWRKDNPQDIDELINLSAIVGDKLETLVRRDLSSIVGQMAAILDKENELFDTIDSMENMEQYMTLKATSATELVGFPTALPYPNWWIDHDADFMYLWDDGTEDEEDGPLMPGDTISSPPNQYLVKWPGISKEDYLSYVIQVQKAIGQNLVKGKKGSAYITYYESASAEFTLIWEENVVDFMSDGSVCLAPYWYTYLQRVS